MAMKRCPDCGEKYSDSYKYCPFCEEEEIEYTERSSRRRGGGRRMHSRSSFSLLTPTLVVLIIIMAGLLIYLLRDTTPSNADDPSSSTQGSDQLVPVLPGDDTDADTDTSGEGTGDTQTPPDTTMPETPDPIEQSDYEVAMQRPKGLSLNKTDYTTRVGDAAVTLTVSGGSGSYQWLSQDDGVASVDKNGKVTAVSSGTVNIVVTDGTKSGVCIVRVRGGSSTQTTTPTTPTTPTPPTTPSTPSGSTSSGNASINREDMTLKVGESFQLKLSGVSGSVSWSIGSSSIATISENGTVKGVSAGQTTATATWSGGSKTCIVRVRG